MRGSGHRPPTSRRLALLLIAACAAPAAAQQVPPLPPSAPSDLGRPIAPPAIALPLPAAVPAPSVPPEGPRGTAALTLSAVFAGGDKPVRAGLVWRVYEEKAAGVPPDLVAKFAASSPTATLPSGTYLIHAAYGLASATRRVSLGAGPYAERLQISAGALKLAGAIEGVPIPPDRLTFSVFVPLANDSEGRLVADKVRPGDLVRLPEGNYHVVSTYGDSNAIMRTDLRVELGRITEATLNHRAATVTLKLVAKPGGEAFAGTSFSVLTPGGDAIREAIGAFPTLTLAEGDYVVVARHDGRVFTREVKVESGINGDIEVVAAL